MVGDANHADDEEVEKRQVARVGVGKRNEENKSEIKNK
jgi:hypothetical protein